MYQLSDYAYHLPQDRIAQAPCQKRSRSRLMRIDRDRSAFSHHRFDELTDLLHPGDLLVVNNTKVVPARLFGRKATGGKVEVLIIDYAEGISRLKETGFFQCDCLVKASKAPREGTKILLEDGVEAQVVQRKGPVTQLRFLNGNAFVAFLNDHGTLPLPPYIERMHGRAEPADEKNYQTVYAEKEGAVAAPTAGLHFSQELMAALKQNNIDIAPITLHVGYGTFVPVRVDDIRDHEIHSEVYSLSRQSADKINAAKAAGKRVIAVGTTSVRTLEFLSDEKGRVRAGQGSCNLFIYPGYRFKCVDAIITNFHLPESTLLMLVSAFYTREGMLAAYEQAIEQKYRFFSYGDAMLIE